MDGTAFLSVRVPESVRNRVKAIAAQRGERVQDLVGGLIERFLADAERQPLFGYSAPLPVVTRDPTVMWTLRSISRKTANRHFSRSSASKRKWRPRSGVQWISENGRP
jgi:hypothetical protein